MSKERIVFLDRDGTLSIDSGYITDPALMVLYPGAASALSSIKALGYRAVIVTNQSAIGRGMARAAEVEATNARCVQLLAEQDSEAAIDLVLYCPHHPDEGCLCRKPKAGMVRNDKFPWEFEPKECWMIGDKLSDLKFGVELGIPPERCLLVLTGDGAGELSEARVLFKDKLQSFADLGGCARYIASFHQG